MSIWGRESKGGDIRLVISKVKGIVTGSFKEPALRLQDTSGEVLGGNGGGSHHNNLKCVRGG